MKTAQEIYLGALWLTLFLVTPSAGLAQIPAGEPLPPETGSFAPAAAQARDRLRVVSFNVHYARDVAALGESLRTTGALRDADVYLLQEIESYPSEHASRAHKLAEALKLNYVYAPARTTSAGGTHGLAILSRFPLTDIEVLPLPSNDLGSKTRRRIALGATVEAGERRLRIFNLHLDTRINITERLAQLAPVLEAAKKVSGAPVLIGGDFNTNPFRWAWGGRLPLFPSSQAADVDAFMAEQGFEAPLAESGSTTRSTLWRARLDAIYIRGLQARGSEVEREVNVSDHFPVWLDLAWPPASDRAGVPPVE